MSTNVTGLFLAANCFLLVIGGCTSNKTVKKEETIVLTTAADTQIKTESVNTKQQSDQPVKQTPIKESIVLDKLDPIQNASKLNGTLEKIYFDFDSYSLSSDARISLQKNTEIIKDSSTDIVRIEGNCDEHGSAEYNLALGEKRAKAAMRYLVTMGIPAKRLTVTSYGEERPAIQGDDETAFSKNRRDEFVIQEQ